jgi:YD repeat-containing protein
LGSGWVYTNTTRDELERLKLLTRTDGNVVQYSYAGCDCGGSATTTVIDELGCQVKTETDFLGRTWKVSEMSAPNAPYNQVTYTYDVLDRLTQISHANGTGTQVQTRSFVYDGYGRLQSETTPEAGTISYTYKPNDLVETTTNALGRIATHTYNSRNLLTGTSYNDGGVTPAVTFQYDDYGARSQMTDGEGVTTYAYDSHRHLQSETRTFSGLPNTTTRISSLIISRL